MTPRAGATRMAIDSAGGLMGAREAAEALGTTPANLARWATLPDPVAELACGRIYLAGEIRALARSRREGGR